MNTYGRLMCRNSTLVYNRTIQFILVESEIVLIWTLRKAFLLLFLFFIFGRRNTYYLLEAFTEILRVIETGHIGYL